MGSDLVIVAIPAADDRIWQISSEKIPHLTLLMLGDAEKNSNIDSIYRFVEHVVNLRGQGPFYLDVDRRGILGKDRADVLHFRKDFCFKGLSRLRNQLLQNYDIRTAYESIEQFPEWQPHLTLGYPETPAHEDKIPDYGFGGIRFDHLAVWTGNYEGPQFRLEYPEREEDLAVAYSETVEDVIVNLLHSGVGNIQHYGAKGMKWGVRKAPQEEGGRREGIQKFLDPQGHDLTTDAVKTTAGVLVPIVAPLTWPAQVRLIRGGVRGIKAKRLDTEEKKFVKNAMSPQNFAAIHNGSIEQTNRGIDSLNKKYPNPNKDAKTQKQYDDEALKIMQDSYRASANSLTNKAGTQHLDVEFLNDGADVKIHAKKGPPIPMPVRVKHAEDGEESITVEIIGKIKRDSTGHIIGCIFDGFGMKVIAQTAVQGAEFVLEHFGTKGMKWGIRNNRSTPLPVSTKAISVVPQHPRLKTKIKTEGGENHPASDDAIKVAEAKIKLKRSGPAALSNKELQDVANRVELEERVKRAVMPKGQKFVKKILTNQGNQGANQFVNQQIKKRTAFA